MRPVPLSIAETSVSKLKTPGSSDSRKRFVTDPGDPELFLIRITGAQKREWMSCESGSFEDYCRELEAGNVRRGRHHAREILSRTENGTVEVTSPWDLLTLMNSLSSNQYSETSPAMFRRLWATMLEVVSVYPLNIGQKALMFTMTARIQQ
jgi:hypothetical protein